MKPKFCVLGAGNGGLAVAGHLVLKGFQTTIFNRSQFRLSAVRARGGIELEGEVEGFAPIELATTDAGEAIREADVLMVVVPANGHRFMAERTAPHLRDGQVVLLNPGRTGERLSFATCCARKDARLTLWWPKRRHSFTPAGR